MQIAVIDLGTGNLRSVEQALKHVAPEQDVVITSDSRAILNADRIVLPGQGAMGTWLASYESLGLDDAVQDALQNKPCFGICVGMQALFEHSAEDGGLQGLGLYTGNVEHFSKFHTVEAKIPHMGWNHVAQQKSHPLWHAVEGGTRFYFLHSYSATTSDVDIVLGETDYHHRFVASVGRDNVFATQFHPEKSHTDGLQLLRNFANWNGQV